MGKSFSSRQIVKMIQAAGWTKARQAGSHMIFAHPTKTGTVTVPAGRNSVPLGTFLSILRQAGLTPPKK